MTDRRRAPRYHVCRSATAQINLLQDVIIQSVSGDDLIVLAPTSPAACDRLFLQLLRVNGELANLDVRVLRTAPVVHDGSVQFRIALRAAGLREALRR